MKLVFEFEDKTKKDNFLVKLKEGYEKSEFYQALFEINDFVENKVELVFKYEMPSMTLSIIKPFIKRLCEQNNVKFKIVK